MSWLQAGYAVGGHDGPDAFLGGAELEEATGEAKRLYPRSSVWFDGDLLTASKEGLALEPNLGPRDMPQAALKACGLPRIDYDDVMAMSAAEAHERLVGLFVHLDGRPVKAYQKLHGMRRHFMTANAKLSKAAIKGKKLPAGVRPGKSRGPNLLPHRLAKQMSERRLPMTGLGFCVGSNAACRSTCLLYSGNNPYGDKSGPGKLRKTEALLLEPVAWMRMLIEATNWHIADCRRHGIVPYVRPNVLSDVPWEMVFPELFTRVYSRWRRLFYDYTKVAGRRRIEGYDLTFSFNGTNERLVDYELDRGVRTAVVFWLTDPTMSVTDVTFMGRRVVDGDAHDFRSLDPPGVIVGQTGGEEGHVAEAVQAGAAGSQVRGAGVSRSGFGRGGRGADASRHRRFGAV